MDSARVASFCRRHFIVCVVGIFLLALAWRFWHSSELAASPFYGVLVGDAADYDRWAREIATADGGDRRVFYQAPLYPYLVAAVYRLSGIGAGIRNVLALQAVLGGLACVALALAGRSFYRDERVGLVAGVLLALSPVAVFYGGLLQKTSLVLLLVCCLLFALARADRGVGVARVTAGLWVGGMLGLAGLARENILIFAPLIPAAWAARWFAVRGAFPFRLFIGFALGLVLTLGPVVARNVVVGGEFALTTSNLGPNFFIGNGKGATGVYRPLLPGRGDARFEQRDAQRLAEEAVGGPLGSAGVSAYWLRRAADEIAAAPGEWLGLLGRKALLVVSNVEQPDSESIYASSDESLPLSLLAPGFYFAWLLPLACLGLGLGRLRESDKMLWLLAVGYGASIVLFFVMGRYRVPLVAILVLLASAALMSAFDLGVGPRSGRVRTLLLGGACAGTALLLSLCSPLLQHESWGASRDTARALTYFNYGSALVRDSERRQEGVALLQRSLELAPGFAPGWATLGKALDGHQREGALRALRRASELEPDRLPVLLRLGRLLVEAGRSNEGEVVLRRALALDAEQSVAWFNLGVALGKQQRSREAIEAYERALVLDPRFAAAAVNIGVELASSGRTEDALPYFDRALRINPESRIAHRHAALAHRRLGNPAAARAHEAALASDL